MATAASELAGTSETATYGPPYNNANGSTQRLLFSPETIAGVRQPDRRGRDVRAVPAGQGRSDRSGAGGGARPLPRRLRGRAERLERGVRQGGDQGQLPRRRCRSCLRPPTGRFPR